MFKKMFQKIERYQQPLLTLAVTVVVALVATQALATTAPAEGATAVTAKEMDGAWEKVSAMFGSGWGKLFGGAVFVSALAAREKIGNVQAGIGMLIGIMLPGIPAIMNTAYTMTF